MTVVRPSRIRNIGTMRARLTPVRGLAIVVAALAGGAMPITAAAPSFDEPATGTRTAVRQVQSTDVVSIYNSGPLLANVEVAAGLAVRDAGGMFSIRRSASVGMRALWRGQTPIQQAPPGWQFPMGVTALPVEAIARVMGFDVSAVVAANQIVMGQQTASLRGAQVGDVVELVNVGGASLWYTIGLIAPDGVVGGTEIVVSDAQADAIGMTDHSGVVGWGFTSRGDLEAAMAARGVTGNTSIRVRRSWDAPDPDSTIGMASTKAALGEFAYTVNGSGGVSVSPEWAAANIPPRELYANIPIRASCHNRIKADLQAALTEVAFAGLGGAIDVANANTYGGCYYPRFNRIAGTLGFLSRHSWAMALDTNTVSNCQGCIPQMNCDVVRIFRRHSFAWGGNFIRPDGMHFEWVGERRDQLAYPSRFCPNNVNGSTLRFEQGDRSMLFATDGLPSGHDVARD
jgi:hypothetical protein